MLTTITINDICGKLSWFKGVYPIDRLPITIIKPGGIIVNLDESHKPGSHWVAVYIDDNKIAHYFDSFGRAPNGNVLTFLEKNSKYVYMNTNKFQGNSSIACGWFCILFILNAQNLSSFYKIFKQCNHVENEKILYEKIKNLI